MDMKRRKELQIDRYLTLHFLIFSSCFLNPKTHFIWVFIAPVIVIIFVNVGFFIMAAITIWKQHSKRQTSGKISKERFRSWLKTLVSLVVVMGLTWIFGVLIVEVEKLVPLAYIYTIMVAFQGLFIFLLFVAFPKEVRDAYVKVWREKVTTLNTFFTENHTKEVRYSYIYTIYSCLLKRSI